MDAVYSANYGILSLVTDRTKADVDGGDGYYPVEHGSGKLRNTIIGW